MKSVTIKQPIVTSVVSAALLLLGTTAIALTSGIAEKKSIFDITSQIFIDGKLVSSPHVVAYANQKAIIVLSNEKNSETLRMGLLANDSAKEAIKIEYNIQLNDNTEKMHFKPEIIVLPNQENTVSSFDSGHVCKVQVIAKRQ